MGSIIHAYEGTIEVEWWLMGLGFGKGKIRGMLASVQRQRF